MSETAVLDWLDARRVDLSHDGRLPDDPDSAKTGLRATGPEKRELTEEEDHYVRGHLEEIEVAVLSRRLAKGLAWLGDKEEQGQTMTREYQHFFGLWSGLLHAYEVLCEALPRASENVETGAQTVPTTQGTLLGVEG